MTNSMPTNLTSLAFCPLSPEDAIDPDRDGDGLAAIDELFVYFTDPGLADTDGDGVADGDEVAQSEALYPDAPTDSRLVHKDWAKYPAALYSCNWHENFPTNDSRRKLTWNGRFTNILDKAFNLYSSGDHAFELFRKGNPHFWSGLGSVTYFAERYCWQKQELGKGCLPSANPLGKTDWAGWGFEKNWKGTRRKRPVPQPGETLSPQELAQYPAFRLSPSWMNSPELSQLQIDSMLAQGIPTITPAVGNQPLSEVFTSVVAH